MGMKYSFKLEFCNWNCTENKWMTIHTTPRPLKVILYENKTCRCVVVWPVSVGRGGTVSSIASLEIWMKWFREVLHHSPWCSHNKLRSIWSKHLLFNHNDSILASHIVCCLRGISITDSMCWTWYFVLDLQLWNKQKC